MGNSVVGDEYPQKNHSGYVGKRLFDIVASLFILFISGPVVLVCVFLVWLQDFHSPFYLARRVGRYNQDFTMIKIRSMVTMADSSGVNSTGAHDQRITRVGRFIRRFKMDEISQAFNVLRGDMSMIGPRPNTRHWGVDLYTATEKRILTVRPGITDLSSILFSDEGAILDGAEHPDLLYNQVIRPWKSRLALWYIENMSFTLDLKLCWLTFLAIINKPKANAGVVALLKKNNADSTLIKICRREGKLPASPPPGASAVETGAIYSHN